MSAVSPSDRSSALRFACEHCGAKIKVPATAVGRRGKCPRCSKVFTVPRSAPPPAGPPPDSRPAPAPPVADDLFSDLVAAEGAGAALTTEMRTQACPGCQAAAPLDAAVCMACGYDFRTGRRVAAAVVSPAPAAERSATAERVAGAFSFMDTSLLRGVLFSGLGAAIGAAVWVGVAVATDYELSLIAWGLGGLAGVGMYAGARQPGFATGALAAGIAALAILVARVLMVRIVFEVDASFADLAQLIIMVQNPKSLLIALIGIGTAYYVGARGPQTD